MHLAKFAPKLTLFPHQSISRGWKIDTSKNGPWKPKLPPFGKKSQTKSIPEEDAFRACSSRIERTRDARNGEKKRAPTRPTTPASAPRSHGSPGLRKTPLRNQTPAARPDPRRGAQREHEEDYRIVSARGPRRRRRRKACPLSLLQLQRGEGGLKKKKKREREGAGGGGGNGEGGRRDATRRRREKEDTLITHKKIAGQQ